jgi:eukaryotic-like serine/threonine-protein kinase
MSIDRSSSTGRLRRPLIALIACITIVAGVATTVAIWRWRQSSPPAPSLQLALLPPDELVVGGGPDYEFGLSLAPDGRRIAFPASKAGALQIWLRDLTHDDLQPLPGTAGGTLPFWSPDGRSLGFFADGKMRVFVFDDGSVRDLADAAAPRGAVWHTSGDIVFAPADDGPLFRRTPDGGVAPFTTLESGVESSHRHPQFVGNGTLVTFFVRSSEAAREGIWLMPYGEPAARRRLVKSDAHAIPVDGGIAYSSGGALVAQRIDVEARTLAGRSILLGNTVGRGQQNQLFATSGGDVLVFGVASSGLRELRWLDRSGAGIGALGEPMEAAEVRIAPGGASVAVARSDPQLSTLDIWSYDAARPLPRRISAAIDSDEAPAWSPDGRRVAWVTGRRAITVRDTQTAKSDMTLRKFADPVTVSDWPVPQWIVATESRAATRSDIILVPVDTAGDVRVYAQSPFNEMQGVVSPDGRWLAYASDESGRFEIYVDAFPTPGRRGRLTVGGGIEPRWGRTDDDELFFRRGSEIHVVRPDLAGAAPVAVSSERLFDAGADVRSFDVAADGQRFLLNLPAADSAPKPMTVLVNVRSLLPSAP